MSNVVAKAREAMARYRAAAVHFNDETALTVPELFNRWKSGAEYAVGDRVRHADNLYKCLTAHTSQDSWTPDVSPSLWVRIDDPAIEFPAWIQPTGATDAYMQGAKVSHNDKRWISNVNNNTWEPGVYGWSEVT